MANPFEKRATEYLREDEAFLAVVTPEPLATFFQKPAKEGRLYDRLAMIIGTPGSGKTTLARLFQYPTLRTLLRNRTLNTYKPLIDTLTSCGAIENGQPAVMGARVSLETEYREFWEFPYPEDLRIGLMLALLQARTVLIWLRNLQDAGVALDDIKITARAEADAALTAIGGATGTALLERARQVERAIYDVSAALVAPGVDEIDSTAAAAYRPFDVIEAFNIQDGEDQLSLRPLVIFDDAHILHPSQLVALQRWLTRRETRVARWVLTRLDALTPTDVLSDQEGDEPGLKRAREITDIWMQSQNDRRAQRLAFRKMAKDMAERYLSQMEVFNRRGLTTLGDLLATRVEAISRSKCDDLAKHVNNLQRQYKISAERRATLEKEVDDYLPNAEDSGEDLRLAMLAILFERYWKRVPQRGLFEEGDEDSDPNRPITADSGVADGARIHLLHDYQRPYFFGIDTLCDASSENAEQFLQLSARLVAQSETQLIRTNPVTLASTLQNKLLRDRAAEIVKDWDFPQHQLVRRIADGIAGECLAKSREGNASLEGGASAFGILQEDFNTIPKKYPDLARILQFGIAYNAFTLIPEHRTKKRVWCLIELGGILLLHYGLTLKRGGFLERRIPDLQRFIGDR
jgi:hypothetical protein